jgi:hypothetical protein
MLTIICPIETRLQMEQLYILRVILAGLFNDTTRTNPTKWST